MITKTIARKAAVATLLLLALITCANSKEIVCSKQAIEFSEKIVRYHLESQGTSSENFLVEVDRDSVKKLPFLKNPAMPSKLLTGVEVIVYISTTATYRTRFIFSTKGGFCSLIGQEVLDVTVEKNS